MLKQSRERKTEREKLSLQTNHKQGVIKLRTLNEGNKMSTGYLNLPFLLPLLPLPNQSLTMELVGVVNQTKGMRG